MAKTYDGLSEEEKADVQTYDLAARGIVAGFSRVLRDNNSISLAKFAERIEVLVADFQDDTVIPTNSDLAGIAPLTGADFKAFKALIESLNAVRADNLTLFVKAVGINAG